MSYDNTMSYTDNVFMRAVELGCEPAPAATSPRSVVQWLCGCPDRQHAGFEDGAITWSRLGIVERAQV